MAIIGRIDPESRRSPVRVRHLPSLESQRRSGLRRKNLPRYRWSKIRGGGQDSVKLNHDRGRQLAHEAESACGIALSQESEVHAMDLATLDPRSQREECYRSGRQHNGEGWKWERPGPGGRQDAVERAIRAELLIQKNDELVLGALIEKGVVVDADYSPTAQERGEEREACLPRHVDHRRSKTRKEIMVMLRQLEVVHGLRLDPGLIEKEEAVVDLVLGIGS